MQCVTVDCDNEVRRGHTCCGVCERESAIERPEINYRPSPPEQIESPPISLKLIPNEVIASTSLVILGIPPMPTTEINLLKKWVQGAFRRAAVLTLPASVKVETLMAEEDYQNYIKKNPKVRKLIW